MIEKIYELFISNNLKSIPYGIAGGSIADKKQTYVTYLIVTDTPNNRLDSSFESTNIRVQFDIYSSKLSEIDLTEEKLIRAIVDEFEGMVNFKGDYPFDINTRRYRRTVDVSFFHS